MHNLSHVAAYEPNRLPSVYQELIGERMIMDKEFSAFLDKNTWTMGEENLDSKVWKTYKAMNEKYTAVVKRIKVVEYYLGVV